MMKNRPSPDSRTERRCAAPKLIQFDAALCKWLLIERNPLQDVSLEAETDYLIELFAGGIGHGYLREGWAVLGVNCTWTLGERAVLEFPPGSGAADYVLKMRID